MTNNKNTNPNPQPTSFIPFLSISCGFMYEKDKKLYVESYCRMFESDQCLFNQCHHKQIVEFHIESPNKHNVWHTTHNGIPGYIFTLKTPKNSYVFIPDYIYRDHQHDSSLSIMDDFELTNHIGRQHDDTLILDMHNWIKSIS